MKVFVFSLTFLASLSLDAATLYCGPSNTGSGSGSDFNNLLQLPTTTGFTRGDTYICVDGSYGTRTFSETASGTTLVTIKHASAADSAVAGYASSLHDNEAEFDTWTFSTSYWLMDGIKGGGPDNWNDGFGFLITPGDSHTAGVMGGGDNLILRHFKINGTIGTDNGLPRSWDTDGMTDVLAEYFSMDNAGGVHFLCTSNSRRQVFKWGWFGLFHSTGANHGEIASLWDGAEDFQFWYCIFRHSEGTGGLILDNQHDPNSLGLLVVGSVFYRASGETWEFNNGLVGGWSGTNFEEFHNNRVYNCTFVNCNGVTLTSSPDVFSGNIARNNLWYNCNSPSFSKFTNHDYNHYVNSGSESESNGTTASGDPFTDFVNLDFSLVSDTAAADTGVDAQYRTDMFGNTGTTRGAIQFSEGGGGASGAGTVSTSVLRVGTIRVAP